MRGDDAPRAGRLLLDYVEVKPHPEADDAVWQLFESLPSQTRPQRGAKPAKRLTALAHELASDGILAGAGRKAHAALHCALDAFQEANVEKIAAKRKAVMTVEGKTLVADMKQRKSSFDDFWEAGDTAVIDDAYRRAARVLTLDIARTYVEHLARKLAGLDDDPEDYLEAIVEARMTVAGLGLVSEVQGCVDVEADKLAKSWLAAYGTQIKLLSDDRHDTYRQIVEMSVEPQAVDLMRPSSRFEATKVREKGIDRTIPDWRQHLLCDEESNFPAELKSWEQSVIEAERRRRGFKFWYRNPGQPGPSSLGPVGFTTRVACTLLARSGTGRGGGVPLRGQASTSTCPLSIRLAASRNNF